MYTKMPESRDLLTQVTKNIFSREIQMGEGFISTLKFFFKLYAQNREDNLKKVLIPVSKFHRLRNYDWII